MFVGDKTQAGLTARITVGDGLDPRDIRAAHDLITSELRELLRRGVPATPEGVESVRAATREILDLLDVRVDVEIIETPREAGFDQSTSS